MFDITKNKASRAYIHNLANQLVKNKDLRGFEPYLGEYMPLEERGNFSLLCKSSEKKREKQTLSFKSEARSIIINPPNINKTPSNTSKHLKNFLEISTKQTKTIFESSNIENKKRKAFEIQIGIQNSRLIEKTNRIKDLDEKISNKIKFLEELEIKKNNYENLQISIKESNLQEMRDLEFRKQEIILKETLLKEKENEINKKDNFNQSIIREIENKLIEIESRKYDLSDDLSKCFNIKQDLERKENYLKEKEKELNEKNLNISQKNQELLERESILQRKEISIVQKQKELTKKDKALSEKEKEIFKKSDLLHKKDLEIHNKISELTNISNSLMKEKQINEQKLNCALKNLSFKEEELNKKINFLMTTESSKEDDLELKLLGLDQVENTFKKKLELELNGYNSELLRLNKKNSIYNENNNKTEKKNTYNWK